MNLNLVFRGCRKTIKEIDPGVLFGVKQEVVSIDDIFMKCDPTDLGNNDCAVHLSTGQIILFDEDKEVYKFPYTIDINVLVSVSE